MKFTTFSDETLITLIAIDDEVAFSEIYDRYWKKLYSLAVFKTNSKETAQEIVQELFVRLWERRNNVSISHLESYLFTALKYQIISHLRQVITQRSLVETSASEASIHTEDFLTAETLQTAIETAVKQLPDKTQAVFRLSRFEEKSHKEIALALDLSEKSVEYHITQALKFLRTYLKDYLLVTLFALIF
jgi:RNA polymerase sigma-70 factor (ECF subfamily)